MAIFGLPPKKLKHIQKSSVVWVLPKWIGPLSNDPGEMIDVLRWRINGEQSIYRDNRETAVVLPGVVFLSDCVGADI